MKKSAPTPKERPVGLGLRIDQHIKAALDRAAADDRRSINAYVEVLLEAHLIEKGYLK